VAVAVAVVEQAVEELTAIKINPVDLAELGYLHLSQEHLLDMPAVVADLRGPT
jgi:hypothetical protein